MPTIAKTIGLLPVLHSALSPALLHFPRALVAGWRRDKGIALLRLFFNSPLTLRPPQGRDPEDEAAVAVEQLPALEDLRFPAIQLNV